MEKDGISETTVAYSEEEREGEVQKSENRILSNNLLPDDKKGEMESYDDDEC